PFYVSPTASHGLVHPDAEAATARAASKANILASFSTISSISMEDIAKAAPIVLGNGREVVRPLRNPIVDGDHAHIRKEASNTWEVVDRLREITRLPLVLKGILTREDARRASDHGAKGVVVSNHGGRQLDRAPASSDALPEVVEEVGSEVEVYFDGGIRRGSDIVMALALGARAVGLGRIVFWALAAGGEAGVSKLLSLLKADLATVMALTGRRTLSEIDKSLVDGAR